MKSLTLVLRVGLFVEFVTIATSSPVIPQVETRAQSDQLAAKTRELLGDDAERASKLEEEFAKARAADRWDEAISKAQELVALRTRGQGAAHFDTVRAEWQLKTARLVAALPKEDRAAFLSARDLTKEGEALFRQGKYADAQPLFERALAIRRRLLTDDHPDTAQTFSQLAVNLGAQAKYAAAEPYCEKTLTIYRRLFSDDHPYTAVSFNNMAANLNAQGKYGLAQPMFEKSLEIHRRLLGDQDPQTALFYKNLANNLTAQGKYQNARPLLEKALEIRRTVLTGDHPDVAESYSGLAANLSNLVN
jgi:tetratricopeptide (TPR) repeat protein